MRSEKGGTKGSMLEKELKQYARSIGVTHLGIGDTKHFAETEALLTAQAEEGTYPPFTEKDIQKRTRPEDILPTAQSILSIAVSYLTPHEGYPKRGDTPRGIVSRYAWGKDYHPILAQKLDAIVAFLQERVGHSIEYASFVDTGPPVDRAYAERAGIGWYGKNACIYVPGSGSWVFLAELLTDVKLQPDPPLHKSCGTCDKCMRACPTGAIERPFWVNPRKCLSYITQMPGTIPRNYRKKMGRHLWGCDICQVVCPWNWEATAQGEPPFSPSEDLSERPALIPLLTMTKSQFKQWFGPTAMGWRGKKIIQRNACICLGNIGDPVAVPPLIDRLFNDPKPVVRLSAAWALGEIGGRQAREALGRAAGSETDPEVQAEVREALGCCP